MYFIYTKEITNNLSCWKLIDSLFDKNVIWKWNSEAYCKSKTEFKDKYQLSIEYCNIFDPGHRATKEDI